MSEAIILYRGRGGVDPESLKPQTITSNGTYKAPVTGNYWVAVVGGGGGGGGGCRNSWNVSQVFYGAGGTRGTLNAGNVFLNAGDEVSVTLGAGGTAGVNNTTVVSNNSRGTNGGTGSTSAFGSYRSGAGGTWGAWSWSEHHWSNTYTWNNILTVENQIISWNNWSHKTQMNVFRCPACGRTAQGNYIVHMYCYNHRPVLDMKQTEVGKVVTEWINTPIYGNVEVWSNKQVWNNRIVNTTTRCYTSIQQGTWWCLNNNQVSTSGARTYRSDGGASGSTGNAGFIVIVPPTI